MKILVSTLFIGLASVVLLAQLQTIPTPKTGEKSNTVAKLEEIVTIYESKVEHDKLMNQFGRGTDSISLIKLERAKAALAREMGNKVDFIQALENEVQLRKAELNKMEWRRKQGMVTQEEFNDAKVQLLKAEIRLLKAPNRNIKVEPVE